MISKNQIKFIKQLDQKKYRKRENVFVAEGHKVVGDLLSCGFEPHTIFATNQWKAPRDIAFQEVTDDELRKISFLQHPQQVLAIFHMPAASPATIQDQLVLALDGVQDPGNLGTIIRIADWFGISDIFCSADTADVWNPKVIQATMGSIARVRITYTDLVALIKEAQVPVYGTLLDGDNIYQQTLSQNGIIVMGNEGNGISPEIRQLITNKLLIPDFNTGDSHAESLNVAIATAITCSEFRRRN
ncbi:RNA methyltransferase [Prevotella sp. E13-17]|uniref:TrmH family RNA methyltransferase n=1 Tax=Prevotella sp. E13-17 TaxID=2913616 RepID=UPI001EDA00DF|nr:RNA methyltransferase [Prevotella sp. E13-17]UKK49770.1 RNA methyltransferase [Prevotella sp. E13-17]